MQSEQQLQIRQKPSSPTPSHSKLSARRERAKRSCKEKIQRQHSALPLETLFLRGYTSLWMATLSGPCPRWEAISALRGSGRQSSARCGGLWELMTSEEGERG